MLTTFPPSPATQFDPALATRPSRIDERRNSKRVPRRLTAFVTALGSSEGICCITENISEGGAYILAPTDCGLCLGHRCEVVLQDEIGGALWACYSDPGAYATIVRTECTQLSGEKTIGAGLRFDQPLYL